MDTYLYLLCNVEFRVCAGVIFFEYYIHINIWYTYQYGNETTIFHEKSTKNNQHGVFI